MYFSWKAFSIALISVFLQDVSTGQPACQASQQQEDVNETHDITVPLEGNASLLLNLTALNWTGADWLTFARGTHTCPVWKLRLTSGASGNAICYNDNQFLKSLNGSCYKHFDASYDKSRTPDMVNLSFKEVTQSIQGKYILYPYNSGPLNTTAALIIIHIEDSPTTTAPTTLQSSTEHVTPTMPTTKSNKKSVAPVKNQGQAKPWHIALPVAVGVVLGAGAVGAVVYFCCKRNRNHGSSRNQNHELSTFMENGNLNHK